MTLHQPAEQGSLRFMAMAMQFSLSAPCLALIAGCVNDQAVLIFARNVDDTVTVVLAAE